MPDIETSLESFIDRIALEAEQNRGQAGNGCDTASGVTGSTEDKWRSNLVATIPENTRPSFAGTDVVWRSSDHKEAWQSHAKSSSTSNAVRTSHDFADDVLFPNGNVPFRVSLVGHHGENVDLPSEVQSKAEKDIEDLLDNRHSKCDGVKHLLYGWDSSATYGPRVFHVYLTDDDNKPDGVRSAFESCNIWECFWDMDNEGEIEDGEYFIRRQRKTRRALIKWAKKANKGSLKDYGKLQVNMEALRAALNQSGSSSGYSPNNTTNQSGTPESNDLLNQTKGEVWDEVWAWMPRVAVDNYVLQNSEAIPWRHPDGVDLIDPATGEKIGEINPPETEDSQDQYVWVLCHRVNGKIVAMLPEPGPLPYKKGSWNRQAGCRDDLGIADANSTNQVIQDGLVKAMDNDLKRTKVIIGYDQDGTLDNKRIEEILGKPIAVIPISKGIGSGSVNDVLSVTNITTNAKVYMEALEFVQRLADLDTGAPRIQQGQKAEGGNTAFELRERLSASGRHFGSKIRALDSDIVWINKRMLEMEIAAGNIQIPSDVEIKGGGFRAYSKQIGLYQTIFTLMQYAETNPEIKDRMNLTWILNELTECQGIDPEKFWISEEEYQQKQQAKQQAPEVALQMQQLQAALEQVQAATSKDNALAEKALSEVKQIMANIEQGGSRLQLDRAKGAMEIAASMKQAQQPPKEKSRMERRRETAEPSAIVRMPRTQQKAA